MTRPRPGRHRGPRAGGGLTAALASCLTVGVVAVGPATAQTVTDYALRAPSGLTLEIPRDSLMDMLERTRRLGEILEKDPAVLYFVGSGPAVDLSNPVSAYPWNAVHVRNDSVVRVSVPANYREARRAYFNYAVLQMRGVSGDRPTSDCSRSVEREAEAISAFVDGWIVTRFLYGGPAYTPLDAFAFARDAGHLPAMLVELGDSWLGGCLERWHRENSEAIEAYRQWRRKVFREEGRNPLIPGPGLPRDR